jgi:hypothetical protein
MYLLLGEMWVLESKLTSFAALQGRGGETRGLFLRFRCDGVAAKEEIAACLLRADVFSTMKDVCKKVFMTFIAFMANITIGVQCSLKKS